MSAVLLCFNDKNEIEAGDIYKAANLHFVILTSKGQRYIIVCGCVCVSKYVPMPTVWVGGGKLGRATRVYYLHIFCMSI